MGHQNKSDTRFDGFDGFDGFMEPWVLRPGSLPHVD
jgi:hypothetical protein